MKNETLYQAMRRVLAAGAAAVALSGCAAFPTERGHLPTAMEEQTARHETWSAARDAVTKVEGTGYLTTRREYLVPDHIAQMPVSFELSSAATLSDLAGILELHDLPTIIHSRVAAQSGSGGQARGGSRSESPSIESGQTLAGEQSGIVRFDGTVGELIELLRELRNLEVEYRGRHLVIRNDALYFMTAPQHKELIEEIGKTVTDLGGSEVRSDINAGLIAYRASPEVADDIERYVYRVASNAAIVHLQVAIINVRINNEERRGFDWNEMAVRIGRLANADVETIGSGLVLSSRGASFGRSGDNLSVTAALLALSEYGDARADQDVTLSTLAGNSVELQSGTEVPYLGSIGSTMVAQTGSSSSAEVDTLSAGLELTIEPLYDSKANLVTSSIDLSLTEVLKMHEFQVPGVNGQEGGTLTHPELQVLAFTNIARLRPGEATLLGGVSYNQLDRDYSSVLGLEDKKVGSRNIRTERHALFILLRPTVTLFGDLEPPKVQKAAATQAQPREQAPVAERAASTISVTAPVASAPAAPAARAATGQWGVQVAAYRELSSAHALQTSLSNLGYLVDVYQSASGFHVIRVSGLDSEAEAEEARRRINNLGHQSIVVSGGKR